MKFLPGQFEIPKKVNLNGFYLRPLSIDDLEEDYKAVMESVADLQGVFGEYSKWPSPNLTKRQNLVDLGWHEKEFQRETSFAYVIENDSRKYIGCLYVYPSKEKDFDADAYMWIRTSEHSRVLIKDLWNKIDEWLSDAWSFAKVRFPTRKD